MAIRGLILVLFIVGSIPVSFMRPLYGIMLWTFIAFLNPQSYTWAYDAFPWAAAIAVPTILGMLVFDRKLERLSSPRFWLLLILWLWFTVTTFVSTASPQFQHHAADTWVRYDFVTKVMLMAAVMIPITSSFQRLRYVVLTVAGCFGFYVLKTLPFIIATGGAHRVFGPEQSMIADNNDFGLALNMTLPLYFFLAQTETKRWVKRFFGFLFTITVPAIFFTYSRGALVGLISVALLMFLQSRRRFALVPVLVLGLVTALFFAPASWKARMDPSREGALDDSALSRLNSWAYARALAADYPITGGGFATFTPELYDRYAQTKVETVYGPHSVYFQVLAEHGYVGLSIYLLLVLSCFIAIRRLARTARRRQDREIVNYAHMFQFSLLAFLVSGVFLGRAYFDYFFTVVAFIIILKRAARDRWAETARLEDSTAESAQQRTVAWAS